MRIRNSWSLNSVLKGRKFDERFLVEETNRHIGWSIARNRSLLSLDIEGDQSHDDSKSMVTGKIKALSHKDKKKGENDSIQEESSQVSKEENGKKADAGNKSNMPTDYEEDESSCEVAVDSINTLTSSYSRPEKDLPIKKRKEYYLLVTETASVEAEDITNTHEEEDLQEDGCKRTKDMSCLVNLECATLKNDSMQVQEILEVVVPEKTAVEPKERRRSGRNRKSLYFSCSEKYLIKYNFIEENLRRKRQASNRNKRREQMQMPEAGMPEKVEYEKKKKKRGRPKMVNDQSQFEIVLGLPANLERCRSKVRWTTKA